jgi:predicted metalloprotease with PDZ domain
LRVRQTVHDRRETAPEAVMKAIVLALGLTLAGAASAAPPMPLGLPPAIPAPKDVRFPGTIALNVDARDTARGIFNVTETIPVPAPGPMMLLYPKWLPGNHGPTGPIDKLAGLRITAGGKPLAWQRDPVDVYAFHVDVPKGASRLDIAFSFLSPVETKEGRVVATPEMLNLEWNTVALYPAGYFARDINFVPAMTLPPGWKFACALDGAQTGAQNAVRFASVPFETLVDSPVFAGKYYAQADLAPGAKVPVRLDIFADQPDELAMTPEQLGLHRNLAAQAAKLFGSHHYDHYDFLFALSDRMSGIGLEHHRSSEDGSQGGYFRDWTNTASLRGLLPHEYTHSWNGKFRRPADLWTPNFNVAMRDSLLWVYEGQTQYWGNVLAARSGLWSKGQALDALAMDAATYSEARAGRAWRPLADTTNDPISTMRRPVPWRSWQRSEDYYSEGALIWLDADTLIRERSGGKKSLDDFAHAFFGVDDGSYVIETYTFDDIVRALNAVVPYDWASFLHTRVDALAPNAPLDGLGRAGWRLSFSDKASDFYKSNEKSRKITDLTYSIGLAIDKDGAVSDVRWGGPAWRGNVTVGAHVEAVNDVAYDPDVLKDAIRDAKTSRKPIVLLLKTQNLFHTNRIDYADGLRYPHLERIAGKPDLLDQILSAKK